MQFHQRDSVLWKNVVTPLIIKGTLVPAMHSTDGFDMRLIKEGDRLRVLAFAVLDDQIESGVVSIYRKHSPGAPVSARVSAQKVKAVLAKRGRS